MNNKDRQSFTRAMGYKNNNISESKKQKTVKAEQAKPGAKLTEELRDVRDTIPKGKPAGIIGAERLQEAIIWSEILGKPVSRRGKRRYK